MNTMERIRTSAETDLVEQFGSLRNTLAGGADISKLREKAFDAFNSIGLPHRRIEAWHYTDLKAGWKGVLPIAGPGDGLTDVNAVSSGLASIKIVLVNGCLDKQNSDLASLPAGIAIRLLSEALVENADTLDRLGSIAPDLKDPLIDLNTAFMGEGVFVDIADDARIKQPIEIVHVTDGEATSSYPRHFVAIGKNAEATFIENHVCKGNAAYQSNSVIELKLGDGATAHWVKMQDEGENAVHVGTFKADIGAEAELNHFTFTKGGALTRTQLFVSFSGEHSKANLRGTSLLNGKTHSDITLVMDHAVPNCDSRELYKSVIDDNAHSVFQGNIIVKPDAQKTDGQMMVQSLLLSDDAAMSSKPELEIFADDVQCAHGSTTGQIDEDLLFYLRSRGIPEAEARTMLVLAFLSETIEEIGDEEIIAVLEERTRDWLGA